MKTYPPGRCEAVVRARSEERSHPWPVLEGVTVGEEYEGHHLDVCLRGRYLPGFARRGGRAT